MLSRRALVLFGLLVLGVLTTSVRCVNQGEQKAEMAQENPEKSRWPEVVGKEYNEAKEIILREVGRRQCQCQARVSMLHGRVDL
jgi:hypothetical protein